MPIESVTVYTAARMLEIENGTVTEARLEGDDLILTTKGGTDINVGSVRGIQGIPGPINATDLANAIADSHPGCTLETTTNQSSPSTSGAWFNISWQSELRDTDSFHSGTSDIITIPATGWYHISGSVVWEASVNGPRMVRYTINGSGDYRMAAVGAAGMGSRSCRVPFAQDVYLTAGQLLRISGLQESGVALEILADCQLSVRFMSPA
jgi:hypothetical protein